MSKHPIPDWLRSQFSGIEDEVQKLGPCGVFTQMRTVTQTYFEQQAEAAQPPALGGEPKVVGWRDSDGRCITHGGSGRYHKPLIDLEAHRAHLAPLQAKIDQLADSLANHDSVSKVMNAWVAEKGQMPWATAIKTLAIITKMPDQERDRLLNMDDGSTERGALIEERDRLQARCDELECDHEWTDDGEFNLHCTKCGKQENHEPYGWVQTRGNAINHFTQEWDVVEEWEAQGFEYKPMFDAAQSTAVEDDPVEYGPTPGCKQCEEAESCGLTDCPECDAQLCEDVNGDGVRPGSEES